jgi:hypothetical protein
VLCAGRLFSASGRAVREHNLGTSLVSERPPGLTIVRSATPARNPEQQRPRAEGAAAETDRGDTDHGQQRPGDNDAVAYAGA